MKLTVNCMNGNRKNSLFILSNFLFLLFVSTDMSGQTYPKREMRAVWIATVNNIDWPSSPNLSVEEQKNEMTRLLDRIKEYNMNTVVFQIRPSADAFYNSSLEPWAQWLNGKQGKAPEPYYDPLEFTIKECRKRGLDVHAWLNPYRAVTDTALITSDNHITRIHPEWFITYGRTVYFDPGLPQTRDYFAGIVSDIVRRYDIDAIHMDDYFYPYRIAKVSFPDDSSFFKYRAGFEPSQRDEWRRNNVNLIIKQLHDSIKAIKPWVELGISPFGVWRNNDKDPEGSATKAGQTNYDDLFADILFWEKKGWIDYIVPQIYWHIGFKVADYMVLSDWWSHNAYGCKLYTGLAPYRINRKATVKNWRSSKEITRQIELNRTNPNIDGSMFFSAKIIMKNPLKLEEHVTHKLFRYPAIQLTNNRITPIMPQCPSDAALKIDNGKINISWNRGNDTKKFIVYKFRNGKAASLNDPRNFFLVTSDTSAVFNRCKKTDPGKYSYYVTSFSYTNNESEPVKLKKKL